MQKSGKKLKSALKNSANSSKTLDSQATFLNSKKGQSVATFQTAKQPKFERQISVAVSIPENFHQSANSHQLDLAPSSSKSNKSTKKSNKNTRSLRDEKFKKSTKAFNDLKFTHPNLHKFLSKITSNRKFKKIFDPYGFKSRRRLSKLIIFVFWLYSCYKCIDYYDPRYFKSLRHKFYGISVGSSNNDHIHLDNSDYDGILNHGSFQAKKEALTNHLKKKEDNQQQSLHENYKSHGLKIPGVNFPNGKAGTYVREQEQVLEVRMQNLSAVAGLASKNSEGLFSDNSQQMQFTLP